MLSTWGQGVPTWVLPGASADLFFSQGVYFGGGGLTDLISASRASSAYGIWADGHLSSFAANTPRITDQGLLIEQASTNLVLRSQTFQNAAWGAFISGLGSAPTVTDGFTVAPDGTNTASRIQFNLNGGTTSLDQSGLSQIPTISSGQSYTPSLWIKSTSGNSGNIVFRDVNAVAHTIAVTGSWQLFQEPATSSSTSGRVQFYQQGNISSPLTDILVWNAQLENLGFATSPIATTSATVTRAADNITAIGALLTAALNAEAMRDVTNLVEGGSNNRLLHYSGGAFVDYASTSTALISNGTNTATATAGSGTTAALVKAAFGMDAASITGVMNAGTKAASANAWAGNTGTVYIGSNNGASALNGYLLRMTFGPTKWMFDGMTTGSNAA